MRRVWRGAVLGAVAVAVASCQPVQPWSSEPAGLDATGAETTEFGTSEGVISPDGTKVAFVTRADDLGPTDTNQADDVYLRDLASGETTLISINEAGTDSGNGLSHTPQFSADGTTLAFVSRAKDLTTDDLTPADPLFDAEHAFLYDLATGQTTWVSVFTPPQDSYQTIVQLLISPDGGSVLYTYAWSNGIYMYDRGTGVVRNVVGLSTSVPEWLPGQISFSPDSSRIVFQTRHAGLDPRDTNSENDVYVSDLATDTTTLVSVNVAGTAAGNVYDSWNASFSPDSTKVVFDSGASDLVADDTNGHQQDVFVRDLVANTTTLVSVDVSGSGVDLGARLGSFTGDGDAVVFSSWSADLVPIDTNDQSDVFHRDLVTGVTTLVSVNAAGTDSANGDSEVVPGDLVGGRVAFSSTADDLGPRDTNGLRDLYARDLDSGVTTLLSANAEGTNSGNGEMVHLARPGMSISADGRRITYVTWASDLGTTDTNGLAEVYVATLRAADLDVTAVASPDPVGAGAPLSYQIDLSNSGPDPAAELGALVVLPEGTEFAALTTTAGSCTPPSTDHPRAVACTFGTGAVGAVATITVDVLVTAPGGSALSAVVIAGSSTIDDSSGDNVAIVETAVT